MKLDEANRSQVGSCRNLVSDQLLAVIARLVLNSGVSVRSWEVSDVFGSR